VADSIVVLVVPTDLSIGTLMGELVRIAGHVAHTLRSDESIEQGIQRVRPAVVLIDCDHFECDEELLAGAARRGVPVVFFSGARSSQELQRIARRFGVASFQLPNGPRLLDRAIREAAAQG
jgi:DNA-binding NtrC family response regulator